MQIIAESAFTPASQSNWRPDRAFLERLRAAYRTAWSGYQQPADSIWAIIGDRRAAIHEALIGDDLERLADILANPADSELYHGIDTLSAVSMVGLRDSGKGSREIVSQTIRDHLGALAQTIGACRHYNPENPRQASKTADAVLDEIERVIRAPIKLPNPFPDEYGLETSRGLLAYKIPMALYQAHRLREILRLVKGNRVLEIGAGMGRTAYHAWLMGIHDYTTIDLPMGIVAQACFLAPALGEEAIHLPGESPAGGRIRLLAATGGGIERPERFDVVLNANSLTEMTHAQATAYFQFARRYCRAFLSVNHEANVFTVREIAAQCGCDSVSRSLSAIRIGYVDETFLFENQGLLARMLKRAVAPRDRQ